MFQVESELVVTRIPVYASLYMQSMQVCRAHVSALAACGSSRQSHYMPHACAPHDTGAADFVKILIRATHANARQQILKKFWRATHASKF